MPEEGVGGTSAPPRKKRGIKVFLMVSVVLALLMIIVYLLSVMHSKKFFLVPEGSTLVVKKGVIFLWGSKVYKPANPNQASLYEAIELPPERLPLGMQEFEDLPSLNQEYVTILVGQAKHLVHQNDDRSFLKGKALFERAKRLEGLNLNQLKDIDLSITEIEYLEAKRAYAGIESTLNEARSRFMKAETVGAGQFTDAREWVRKVDTVLEVIRTTKNAAPSTTTSVEPELAPQKPALEK